MQAFDTAALFEITPEQARERLRRIQEGLHSGVPLKQEDAFWYACCIDAYLASAADGVTMAMALQLE